MRDQSAQYFPIMERFYASKLSVKAFSEQSGIKVTTLDYWKKRYRDKNKTSVKGFAALTVVEGTTSKGVTIQYVDGTRIMFEGDVNTQLLKELLPAFTK